MIQTRLLGEVLWYNKRKKNGLIKSSSGEEYLILEELDGISGGTKVQFNWKAGFLENSRIAIGITKEE